MDLSLRTLQRYARLFVDNDLAGGVMNQATGTLVRESTATASPPAIVTCTCDVYYRVSMTQPFDREPEFGVTSTHCDLSRLVGKDGRTGGTT